MADTVYLGNPNLKKANVKVEFTQENIEDVKIIDDKHVVLFKTNIHFVLLVCSI